jgi:hypothetical protein
LKKRLQQREKSAVHFVTREVNPWVMSPGLIALFGFIVILWYILTFGQSSTGLIGLVFFGTVAFSMLSSPLYTTIKVTEYKIDWKIFGKLGTIIYLDELRSIRIHHRIFVKLEMESKWWKPTMCPADQEGFLRAVKKLKPNLPIEDWTLRRRP